MILVSFSIFAQGPNNPPPPFGPSMNDTEAVNIDDWVGYMIIPAALLAFVFFCKIKKRS
jgi:hypothetical protein